VKRLRLVVLGTLASDPYAGMAWMHMQIAAGLRRLGHEVYYFETTSAWPYDPIRLTRVCDSEYAVPYLERVVERFGFEGCWAYRRSYSDKAWIGMEKSRAEDLLAHADAVFNIAGATLLAEEGLRVGQLTYFGTDPVGDETRYAQDAPGVRARIEEHHAVVTYGENIGRPECPIPPLPRLRSRTRQPVLLDLWCNSRQPSAAFTTVANWKQTGKDIEFGGETYYWSKHHEFLKFIDLPRRVSFPIELALGGNLDHESRNLLELNGWRLTDAQVLSTDPWRYREYVFSSRGEFTVAKDQNVRLRSGWFSERSACYLAAGRPVITQDTGFGTVLPRGEGLFSFNTMKEALAAFAAINADYGRHSRAARAIAEEYFKAEKVLARVLNDLGL
jgi:hypothetical protein